MKILFAEGAGALFAKIESQGTILIDEVTEISPESMEVIVRRLRSADHKAPKVLIGTAAPEAKPRFDLGPGPSIKAKESDWPYYHRLDPARPWYLQIEDDQSGFLSVKIYNQDTNEILAEWDWNQGNATRKWAIGKQIEIAKTELMNRGIKI